MARLSTKQKPRRSGAPVPLLVPCFLARTRPLLYPPPSYAAQHERAGRARMGPGPHGRLYRRPARAEQPAATAILHGLTRRTAPQTQPPRSNLRSQWPEVLGTAAPQTDMPTVMLRQQLPQHSHPAVGAAQAVGRHKKAPPERRSTSGARGEVWFWGLAHYRTTYKVGPLRSVTQADSAQEKPRRKGGTPAGPK